MTAKLFPTHFQIILDESERGALETLYDLDPHLIDEVELLHDIIRAGIRALNQTAVENRDPHKPTRRELDDKTSPPFRESKFAQRAPVPHRHIELYVGFPIPEELRRRVENFLDDHASLDEEAALALLLDAGVDVVIRDPTALHRAIKDLTTAMAFPKVAQRAPARVAKYVGIALDPLRQKQVNDFLRAHPHLLEDDGLCILLDLGLRYADREDFAMDPKRKPARTPGSLAPTPPKSASQCRQEHRARWRALCRNVARGWR